MMFISSVLSHVSYFLTLCVDAVPATVTTIGGGGTCAEANMAIDMNNIKWQQVQKIRKCPVPYASAIWWLNWDLWRRNTLGTVCRRRLDINIYLDLDLVIN